MQQVTDEQLTGRYAIVKILPGVYALKVEVFESVKSDDGTTAITDWRLASDKDVIELGIPMVGRSPQFLSTK